MKPIHIKAGDRKVKLGILENPPKVDCVIISTEQYNEMLSLIEKADSLVGSSADMDSVGEWAIEYNSLMENIL